MNRDSKDKHLCNTLSITSLDRFKKSGHDCPLFVCSFYHLKSEKALDNDFQNFLMSAFYKG